jgi:hypothetical protein
MAFKLSVDMPNLAPDGKVSITGLGELQNGKTYKISDEQADLFRTLNGHIEDKTDPETGMLVSRETVPGPALDEVEIAGIKVEPLKESGQQASAAQQGEGN